MCLATRLKKPFIAKNDIICYKYLNKCGEGDYYTPYQQVKVELGEKMVADPNRSYEGENWNNYHKHAIGDGFIHALLGREGVIGGDVCVKAIIPYGTEFYIGDDCTEICARELMLTTEVIGLTDVPSAKIAIRELFDDYFEGFFDPTKVDVGHYRLADGGYVSPTNLTEDIKEEIIGVVACIHDNKVHVVSLDYITQSWRINRFNDSICKKQYTDFTSIENDFDGEGNTKAALSHDTYSPKRYPAFAWVSDYQTKGTKKGDWHMGAAGEIIAIGRYNQLKINIALALLDNSSLIGDYGFWSSSEYSHGKAWHLEASNGLVYGSNKYSNYDVPAFLTFDA